MTVHTSTMHMTSPMQHDYMIHKLIFASAELAKDRQEDWSVSEWYTCYHSVAGRQPHH